MAVLHPFRALRPVSKKVDEVASVPYDVISVKEARSLAQGKPLSFLHIIRPEIDLPEDIDEHADAVYDKGAANLNAYAESKASIQEDEPSVYVYRLIRKGQAQTGVFACVAVADYDNNVILKHEKTRPVKEDDRTRHIVTQQAHAEPVMLTYRDTETIDALVAEVTAQEPLYDFTASDGVAHTVWRVADAAAFVEAFAAVDHLYVADGHHRCKAASRAAETMRARTEQPSGSEEYEFFPAVLFPMGQMTILPYNRLIKELPVSPAAFLERLEEKLDVTPARSTVPAQPGYICFYLDGTWYAADLPPSTQTSVEAQLDVARLGEHLLAPLLGITDPRRDPNIDFVGGIRGTVALAEAVDSGRAAMGISMFATSIEELVAVSDAGALMPPKSTWFEPKLRSGLLVHLFD